MKSKPSLQIVLSMDYIFNLLLISSPSKILSLRLQKLLQLVKRTSVRERSDFRGVFDRDGGQTLYLFVDVKTNGPTTWPSVVQALQPLREKGWLSKVNGTTVTKGPITVVGTGIPPNWFTDRKETHRWVNWSITRLEITFSMLRLVTSTQVSLQVCLR